MGPIGMAESAVIAPSYIGLGSMFTGDTRESRLKDTTGVFEDDSR